MRLIDLELRFFQARYHETSTQILARLHGLGAARGFGPVIPGLGKVGEPRLKGTMRTTWAGLGNGGMPAGGTPAAAAILGLTVTALGTTSLDADTYVTAAGHITVCP